MFRKLHVTPNVIIRKFLRGGGGRVTLISFGRDHGRSSVILAADL